MQVKLTDEQKAAILEALSKSVEDNKNYLRFAKARRDYGTEWPMFAGSKARHFFTLGNALRALGAPRFAEDAEALAMEFLNETARELQPS